MGMRVSVVIVGAAMIVRPLLPVPGVMLVLFDVPVIMVMVMVARTILPMGMVLPRARMAVIVVIHSRDGPFDRSPGRPRH
jgi:hypothetical protein